MKKFIFALLAGWLFFSCSKGDIKKDEKPPHQQIPGMGETPGALQGTVFNLPLGIILENNEINGFLSGTVCKEISTGSHVEVYFRLKNTTGAAITVNFPAGLTIKALSSSNQNGFVIQNESVTVTANAVCLVLLNAYCINSIRSGASGGDTYSWGPVTNAPELLYLINLCKNKRLEKGVLQGAIWNITDGDGLNDYDIQDINALPNK